VSTLGKGDHVIADGFFPEQQRSDKFNPIRVPACLKCNGGFAGHEQALVALFTLSNDARHPEAANIARGPVLRSASHKPALANYDRAIERMEPALIVSADGTTMADTFVIQPEYRTIEIVLSKIAKGLYFHHFQERFPNDYEVAVFDHDRQASDCQWIRMQRIGCNGPFELADGIFRYAYSYAEDDPAEMTWLMSFYRGIDFGVLTSRPRCVGDILELQREVGPIRPGKYRIMERHKEHVTIAATTQVEDFTQNAADVHRVATRLLAAFRRA